jgi:hypothetical protein
MRFNLVLFSAITLLMGGMLVFVAACNKHEANATQNASTTIIADARQYFESSVLSVLGSAVAPSQNPQAALPKTPIWGLAYTTKTALGDMIVVPVAVKSKYYVKKNSGNQSFSTGLFTSLVIYKDSSGSYHAELVTKIPDDSYIADLSSNKKFTGTARIEDWQGNFIKGYHYTNGTSDKYYASSSIVHKNGQSGTTSTVEQLCTITDEYACSSTDEGATWSCEYEFSTESCVDVGGDGGDGSGGTAYQNVNHYTGSGSGGSGGTWAPSTNVDMNLCTTVSFTTDANGYYIANFNGIAETWVNNIQGTVSISFPNSCITLVSYPNQSAGSVSFDAAYMHAKLYITDGLNDGSILPADVSSKFYNYLGYYLHIGGVGSTWNAYSNCSITAPINTPSWCEQPGD